MLCCVVLLCCIVLCCVVLLYCIVVLCCVAGGMGGLQSLMKQFQQQMPGGGR